MVLPGFLFGMRRVPTSLQAHRGNPLHSSLPSGKETKQIQAAPMRITREQHMEDVWLSPEPCCPDCGRTHTSGERCATCEARHEVREEEQRIADFIESLAGLSDQHLADAYCSHMERTTGRSITCAYSHSWFYPSGPASSARVSCDPMTRKELESEVERLCQEDTHETKRSPKA